MTLTMHAVTSTYRSWIGPLFRFLSTEIKILVTVLSEVRVLYTALLSSKKSSDDQPPRFVDPLISRSRPRLPRLRDTRASRKPPCDVYRDDRSIYDSPRSHAHRASTSTASIIFWNLALTFSTSMIITRNGSSETDCVVNRIGMDMVCIGSNS